MAEERASELDDRLIEIILLEEQREKNFLTTITSITSSQTYVY